MLHVLLPLIIMLSPFRVTPPVAENEQAATYISCGVCEDDDGPSGDVHIFAGGTFGGGRECEGPGGHPVHDCVNGDEYYAPGTCAGKHDECAGLALSEDLSSRSTITRAYALQVAEANSTVASYDDDRHMLTIVDCRGVLLASFRVLTSSSTTE